MTARVSQAADTQGGGGEIKPKKGATKGPNNRGTRSGVEVEPEGPGGGTHPPTTLPCPRSGRLDHDEGEGLNAR